MDNKQDRQFLWNVKDFLVKTPEVQPKRPSQLKETIKNVMLGSPKINSQLQEVAHKSIINSSSDLKNSTAAMISIHQFDVNNQKPSTTKHSNNITANIFNIVR